LVKGDSFSKVLLVGRGAQPKSQGLTGYASLGAGNLPLHQVDVQLVGPESVLLGDRKVGGGNGELHCAAVGSRHRIGGKGDPGGVFRLQDGVAEAVFDGARLLAIEEAGAIAKLDIFSAGKLDGDQVILAIGRPSRGEAEQVCGVAVGNNTVELGDNVAGAAKCASTSGVGNLAVGALDGVHVLLHLGRLAARPVVTLACVDFYAASGGVRCPAGPAATAIRGNERGVNGDVAGADARVDAAGLKVGDVERINADVGVVHGFLGAKDRGLDDAVALVDVERRGVIGPVGEDVVAGDPDKALVTGNGA